MKILVAHTRYRSASPSGENVVVDSEINELMSRGIEVVSWLPSSDVLVESGARGSAGAVGTMLSATGSRDVAQRLAEERPDVLHLHNPVPLIGPGIVTTAQRLGIPTVMTVHNYRLDCVNGLYFRGGHACTDCTGRAFASPAVRHSCYRESRLQSFVMAVARSRHHQTWGGVARFLALTTFHRDFLLRLRIEPSAITIRPTSCPDPGEPSTPGRDVLYLGRLSREKGIDVLLDAWQRLDATGRTNGRTLHIAGAGHLATQVVQAARNTQTIRMHGSVSAAAASNLLRQCGVLAIPSTCFEGLPRVAVEAAAHGRALMTSEIGGLPDLAKGVGRTCTAGDALALAAALENLNDGELVSFGLAARRRYLAEYTTDIAMATLLQVYEEVTAAKGNSRRRTD